MSSTFFMLLAFGCFCFFLSYSVKAAMFFQAHDVFNQELLLPILVSGVTALFLGIFAVYCKIKSAEKIEP